MQIGVEGLIHGVHPLDAEALQRVEQLALYETHAIDKALERRILLGRGRDCIDGTLKVVGHVDDFMCQAGDRVLADILLLALRPLAQVFQLGLGAQPLVLEIRTFCLQRHDDIQHRARALARTLLR